MGLAIATSRSAIGRRSADSDSGVASDLARGQACAWVLWRVSRVTCVWNWLNQVDDARIPPRKKHLIAKAWPLMSVVGGGSPLHRHGSPAAAVAAACCCGRKAEASGATAQDSSDFPFAQQSDARRRGGGRRWIWNLATTRISSRPAACPAWPRQALRPPSARPLPSGRACCGISSLTFASLTWTRRTWRVPLS